MDPTTPLYSNLIPSHLYPQFNFQLQSLANMYSFSPSSYDLSLMRFNAFKMAQQKAHSFHTLNSVKNEPGLKTEVIVGKIESDIKTEASEQQSASSHVEGVAQSSLLVVSPKNLKIEIQHMVRFLLSNMGKDNEALLDQTRTYYAQNQSLVQIYDKLRMKYFSAKKCKEDIIRYILRKVFRAMRTSIMKNQRVCSKKASLILCKRHFYENVEKFGDLESEDEILESLMPFNKNSKNKTMNLNFVLEIFRSKTFCEEYEAFLPELTKTLIREHKQKEEKLVNMLVECVKKENLSKLNLGTRLPWTDVWVEDAKNIAIGIMPNKRLVYTYKKPKI